MAMSIDAAEANKVGLTPAGVSHALSGALLGVDAGQIYLDDRSVGVRVRAPDSVRFDPLRLGAITVLSPDGPAPVPIASVARFTPLDTRAEPLREYQQQLTLMTASLGVRALGSVIPDVKAVLAQYPPP